MAFNIGELVGYVKIDSTGVKSGMQDAERQVKAGMDRTGAAAEKGGKETGNRFTRGVTSVTSGGLKTLAAGVVAGFAIDRVVSFLGDATQAASDLQQTAMKSNVIFGSQAKAIDEWASKSVDSFGLSKTAALDAAAGFGDMLQQLGDTQSEAAKTSKSVVQMAADLGSFNNLETGDVLDRISASLRGEYDSLQALIPNINAARVEQEAMAATGKTNAAALTAQEKAHATLAIIQKDGSRAQGDFARSAGTFAIEQQKATARSEELSAKIGEQLLPIMTTFQQILSDQILPAISGFVDVIVGLGSALGSIPGPIMAAVVALTAFHLLKGPVSSMLETVALKSMYAGDAIKKGLGGGALSSAKAGLSGIVGLLGGPWGAALTGATLFLGDFVSELQKGEKQVDSIRNALSDLARAGDLTPEKKLEQFFAIFKDDLPTIRDQLAKAGVSWDEYTNAIANGGPALSSIEERLLQAGTNAGIFGDHLGTTIDITHRWNAEQETSAKLGKDQADALDKVGGSAKDAAPSLEDVAQAQRDSAAAAEASAEAEKHAAAGMDAHNEALQTIQGSLADVGDATDELNQKVQDKAQAEADATKSTTDGWQDYADGVKLSAKDVVKTLDEQTRAAENWRKNLLTVQKQGDEQFTAWVSQQPAQVAQAYASGTEAQKKTIYDAYKRNVGAQQALGVADGLAAGQQTVTDAAGNVYTATKDKLTGQMILIPVGVSGPSGESILAARRRIAAGLAGIKVFPTFGLGGVAAALFNFGALPRRFGGPVGPIPGYAGGTLVGPGTGTSDSIAAFVRESGNALALSNGEFISTDSSRRRNQAALEAGNKGAMLEVAGGSGGSVGGEVTLSRSSLRALAREMSKLRIETNISEISKGLA